MWRYMLLPICLLASACCLGLWAQPAVAADWPQLQGNAQHTGYTADSIAPPYRVRWMWLGPSQTLRNHASNASWPDDLTSRSGYNFPLPSSVSITLADFAQPVVSGTRVFIGDQQGNVYAINYSDGTTLWTQPLPGGTVAAGAVSGSTVVFVSVTGIVRGYSVTDGTYWTVNVGRCITAPPLVFNGVVYVGDHGGIVRAIDPASGTVSYSRQLGGAIKHGLAGSGGKIYVGAENMVFYAMNTSDLSIANQHQCTGQSFRMAWPVILGSYVYAQLCMIPLMGSDQYTMDSVCQAATSIDDEQNRILQWQQGQGGYSDASPDWKHLHVMNLTDLAEPFTVPCGVSEGCGLPPEPPVADASGRALFYWKTKYPKLTQLGQYTVPGGGGAAVYGTCYSLDISAMDTSTGRRIVIDPAGHVAGVRIETDNMYGLSMGGSLLFMRQRFRGTQSINITNASYRYIQQESRYKDGGDYTSDVYYDGTNDSVDTLPSIPADAYGGRDPVVISGTQLFLNEAYCVTAIEHY